MPQLLKASRLILNACCAITLMLTTASMAQADFGEIDLMVKESISAEFILLDRPVDLSRLKYLGKPQTFKDRLLIRTSVWGQASLNPQDWDWYTCETEIKIQATGRYVDWGSDCQLDY
jgi:hypothetical protein